MHNMNRLHLSLRRSFMCSGNFHSKFGAVLGSIVECRRTTLIYMEALKTIKLNLGGFLRQQRVFSWKFVRMLFTFI